MVQQYALKSPAIEYLNFVHGMMIGPIGLAIIMLQIRIYLYSDYPTPKMPVDYTREGLNLKAEVI